MIFELELFVAVMGPLVTCCAVLSLYSKKLRLLRFGLYIFIAIWLVPLVLWTDIEIGAVVFYMKHYYQLQNVVGISKFQLAGWAVADPLNDGPHISLWIMVLTECVLFFVFAAGWGWFDRRGPASGLTTH